MLWWEEQIPKSRVGSRRFSGHMGRSGSTAGSTFGRGRAGQSHSPSEVGGRGRQPHLRKNSGERYYLGLGYGQCGSGEWTEAEYEGPVRIADQGEKSSDTRDWVAGQCHFHHSHTCAYAHISATTIHPSRLATPFSGEQSHYTKPHPTGPSSLFKNPSLTTCLVYGL